MRKESLGAGQGICFLNLQSREGIKCSAHILYEQFKNQNIVKHIFKTQGKLTFRVKFYIP